MVEPLIIPTEFDADFKRAEQLARVEQRDPRAPYERIQVLESILLRIPRGEYATFRGALNVDLGLAYANLPAEDRAGNLEKAIAYFREALHVFNPDETPTRYAATQYNLGHAYDDLPTEDRAANLKQAIACYQEALCIFTLEETPLGYAATQNNLGAAYAELPTEDREGNLKQAIACYQEALRVYTPEEMPLDYAKTQKNLGLAYEDLPTGGRAANLEQAIACYQEALRVLNPGETPLDYAETQNILGRAYADLPTGDRAANLEQAITCYQEALRVFNPDETPLDYAATQYNLGDAYAALPTEDRAGSLKQAIACYREALRFRTLEVAPLEYARTQNNLGATYASLPTEDRAANLEQAIACYQEALRVFTLDESPLDYAKTQNNLGNAYDDLPTEDRAANLKQAIACYQEALRVYTPEKMPLDYATIQYNLGVAYRNMPTGGRAANLEHAIGYHKEALRFRTPEADPRGCRRTARSLGDLHLEESNLTDAYNAYATAIRAAELLHRSAYSPRGKEAELSENTTLYERMVQVCLEKADYVSALVHTEGGKARAFLDQMGQGSFPRPPDLPPDLLQHEADLVEQLRQQDQALAMLSDPRQAMSDERSRYRERELIEHRGKTLAALELVWDEMARSYPTAQSYVAARRGEPMTWDDLRTLMARLGPDVALVEFYTLPQEVIVFVLRAGWNTPRVHRARLSQQELFYRYLLTFQDEVLNRWRLSWSGRIPTHAWLGLGEHLLAPLEPLLGDAALVYVVPHSLLHYLPLHALTVTGEPFIARRAVAYAPSAAVLARTLESAPSARPEPIAGDGSATLVMGYTPNAEERRLFEGEAQEVAALLHASPLLGTQANAEALGQFGSNARVIHLSCHGHFRGDDPAASSVYLASGEFTTRDWMALPLRADLVTLSACETGFNEIKTGDDLTGLTRAILYAGASSALVTLWSVSADTTREWMVDFYSRVLDAQGHKKTQEAFAFQKATLALRRKKHDPYYWAPFTLVGDWR